MKKAYPWLSGILAVLFTVYIALDTFVIPRTYAVVTTTAAKETTLEKTTEADKTTAGGGEESAGGTVTEEVTTEAETVVTDSSYSDGNISITITQYREHDTDIYVADITLTDASYLKTAFAKNAYGKNVTEKTSEQAEDVGAILAINGDYYGAQETGFVIRNGVLYRSEASDGDALVEYGDGTLEVIAESDVTAEDLLDAGAVNVWSFGPGLISDGDISIDTDAEVSAHMTSNPRTAVGQIDDLHYIFVVADGRTDESAGLSLYELAEFMQDLGATTAYNLDGGGSSTMVFNGTIINVPTSSDYTQKERKVSDIVYIGY